MKIEFRVELIRKSIRNKVTTAAARPKTVSLIIIDRPHLYYNNNATGRVLKVLRARQTKENT